MNSSSSSLLDLNLNTLLETMDTLELQHIELTLITERRENKQETSYQRENLSLLIKKTNQIP